MVTRCAELGRQGFQRQLFARAHDRVVAGREDRADLDERRALACRDRGDPAARAERIDVALADRPLEFDARAERRARHQADAALGFRGVAGGAEPVDIDAQGAERADGALEPVERAGGGSVTSRDR